ncbi:MAG: response regulator [Beijerinckiaceae bacterium]
MMTILIVDDEEPVREFVRRALEMDGHKTETAADGAEALDILTARDGAFDLLLTDIKMPLMDGIALALAAARDFPDLKIMLMTGFADQRERARNLDALVRDVLVKPFSLAELRARVKAVLAAD